MRLENFIFNILESKTKSFLVYFITFVLFALSIATFPSEIVKAKMLPSKDSNTFSIYVDLKKFCILRRILVQCQVNSF